MFKNEMGKLEKVKLIILTLVVGSFFGIVSQAQAYDWPIGIPHAWIEPDVIAPSMPSTWSSEQMGYYYINYQTGSDSHTYGTPTAPRQTIPNPIPAGSNVWIHGDYNYVSGGGIWIHGVGTSQNPIWVQSDNGQILATAKTLIYGSYVYLSGVDINGGSTNNNHDILQIGSSVDGYPADHILVRDSNITGNIAMVRTSGVGIIGHSVSSADSNIIIVDSEIHDTGDVNSPDDDDAHIVTVGNWCSNIWILNNTIHDGSGAGAQIGGVYESKGFDNTHHVYFGGNEIYGSRQAGTGGKFFVDSVFSQNYIHDVIDTSWSEAKGLGFQYHNNNLWFIFNHIEGGRFGIKQSSDNTATPLNFYIIGNQIVNTNKDEAYTGNFAYEEAAIGLWGNDNYYYIINNTLYNNDSGIVMVFPNVVDISNNIISLRQEITGHDLYVTGSVQNDSIKNNDWHNGSLILTYNGTTYNTAASLDSATLGSGSIDTNPQFVTTGSDFHLQSGSPARNTGLASTALSTDVYSLYQSTFGVDLKRDIENNVRPQGTAWDMGVYEFIESSGTEIRADVDQNSTINSTDAMLTLRNSLGLDMSSTNWQVSATTGDVNCDDSSNSTDAMLILRKSLGLDMSGTGWCGN